MSENNIKRKEAKSLNALRIEGHEALIAIAKTEVINYVLNENGSTDKYVVSSEQIEQRFELKPISIKEFLEYKKDTTTSGFVLKENGLLYYTAIPSRLYFTEDFHNGKKHKCIDCARMLALPFEKGGCTKAMDRKLTISKYDFITDGYQVFNTHYDAMPVYSCKYYKKAEERKKTVEYSANERLKRLYENMPVKENIAKDIFNDFFD